MDDEEKLKLGKGVAFVKSRLKRLPHGDDTWEADFEALPQPFMQSETHYLGMAVEKEDGWLLAELTVHMWREHRRCPIQQKTSQPIAQFGGAIGASSSGLFVLAWPGQPRSGQWLSLQTNCTGPSVAMPKVLS